MFSGRTRIEDLQHECLIDLLSEDFEIVDVELMEIVDDELGSVSGDELRILTETEVEMMMNAELEIVSAGDDDDHAWDNELKPATDAESEIVTETEL